MMFSSRPFFSAILTVCLLVASEPSGRLWADDPEQLVLLTNGNVLRGIAEGQGELVILHRQDGSRLRLQRTQVAYRGENIEDLYRFRTSQRSFQSTAIFADDVRWCLRNGLIDQAESELKNLQALDPSNPEGTRLQRQIAAAREPHATAPPMAMALPVPTPVSVDEASRLPESLSPASIAEFASRVQPMLINRCGNAGCHRVGGDAAWQLSHLGVNVRVSSRTTQRNLGGILNHLNLDDPFESELLAYSTRSHADGRYQPVGRSAQSAEATLREWLSSLGRYPQPVVNDSDFPIRRAGFDHPSLPPSTMPHAGIPTIEPIPLGFIVDAGGELMSDPNDHLPEPRVNGEPHDPNGPPLHWPPPVVNPGSAPAEKPSRPSRLPAVANPFSADLFNRRNQVLRP